MIDIEDLEQKAKAATPGPWIGCGPSFGGSLPKYLNEVVIDRPGDEDDGYAVAYSPVGLDVEATADMDFIAAANPTAVIELISRLKAAEAARIAAQAEVQRLQGERNAMGLAIKRALDGEVEEGHPLAGVLQMVAHAGEDSDRYRWLRKQQNDCTAPRIDVVRWERLDESANGGEGLRLDELDAAIDVAMAKEADDPEEWGCERNN